MNKSAARLLGSEPEKTVGKSIFDLFPKEVATDFQEGLKNIYKTGCNKILDGKMVIDDRELHVSTSLTAMKDSDGKILGILGITRDVTGSEEMEKALRESEHNYRTLVETAHNGIIWTEGPRRTITYVNPRMAQMIGYTIKELVGTKLHGSNTSRRNGGIFEEEKRSSRVWK